MNRFISEMANGRSPASIVQEFLNCREYKLCNSVKPFAPPGHFYSPVVDPAVAKRHLDALEAAPIPQSVPGIDCDMARMIEVWDSLLPFLKSIPFPAEKNGELRYAFNNANYSWGDGSILHAMLRLLRPKRLVEIGGGWSSACALDTVEKHLKNNCEFTFIEPYPQLLRELMGNVGGNVRIIEKAVQQVPLQTFDILEKGDVLFIDSTLVFSTGSDVCFELFEVLPRLNPGVFVHFHDIFWPFEYRRPTPTFCSTLAAHYGCNASKQDAAEEAGNPGFILRQAQDEAPTSSG